ncbi:pentatricopeptide repeat-containing protein At1g11630, mitochondrial-like [Tasmannia lanceolata]|uniref:pentatricopeptide repeat-containing protein At1g11630, mitochondrial-like n=1 Tax=Tasmannia lanceolata TaxID=3420 RepID=UPI004063CD82
MAALGRNPKIFIARTFLSTLASPTLEKPSISFRTVKSTIRSESDPEKIAHLFLKSSDSSRFRRDRSVFDLSVRKLSGFRRLDLIERILEHQKSHAGSGASKSEGFWIRIMTLYSNSGMVDQALRTFDQIEKLGFDRTEKSLCALLSVFLENNKFDRVHESFAEIPAKIGVNPGVAAYNLVLRAFCEEKSFESARSLLDKMEKEHNVKPNIVSYNTLLGGYFKAGDEVRFDEIVKEISKKGLSPNVVTYNYRIFALCKKNDSFRAKELLDLMVSKGIEPNSSSFNAVIDGFCNELDFESAKSVYESMRLNNSVSPNSDTYVTLIRHLVEKGEFDSALDMCKESIRRKWVPPFASMEGLVNGLVMGSKVDEAKDIVEKMKKKLRGSAVDSWMKVEGVLPL